MSMIGGFFKKQKYQRFEYKPRYWDEDKEELHERIKAAKGGGSKDPEAIKQRISKSLRRKQKSSYRKSRKNSLRSTLMLLIIIIGLVAISYYLLTVYLPQIEEMLK